MLLVIRDQSVVYEGVGMYSMEKRLREREKKEEIHSRLSWPDGQGFPHLLVLVLELSRWSVLQIL